MTFKEFVETMAARILPFMNPQIVSSAVLGCLLLCFTARAPLAQVTYDAASYRALTPASSAHTIPPGTTITLSNWQQYRQFMPVGMQAMFGGRYPYKIGPEAAFAMEVGATIPIPLPRKMVLNTEKYSAQVQLKELTSGGYGTSGYVAGTPFPSVSLTDLMAGYKVIYNNRYRFLTWVAMFKSLNYAVDRYQNVYFTLVQSDEWRLSHLSDGDMPTFPSFWNGYLLSSRFFVMEPEESKYTTLLRSQPDDAERVPEIYAFLPSLRRALRLSSAARCSPALGTDFANDDSDSQLDSPGLFKVTLLGDYKILTMLHDDEASSQRPEAFLIKSSLPGWPTAKVGKWELRDTYVAVAEPLPVLGHYCYAQRVLYIDKETSFLTWLDLYDTGSKFWKVEFILARPHPISTGEMMLDFEGTSTMLDFQNSHTTVVLSQDVHRDKDTPEDVQDVGVYAFPGSLGQIMK